MAGGELTWEEKLALAISRCRAAAAALPAGEAIGPEAAPEHGGRADRPAAAVPVREEGPPQHWQELAEERSLEVRQPPRSRLQVELGDLVARDGACARLRALLADGAWHSALELVEAGGLRFGARLFELRRGQDGGPPLDVEGEARDAGGRSRWFYRRAAPGREPR
ncbi:hypothetical protein ACOQFB_00965 [Anaeromyxobacter sp. Red801]|uniref:hypothetical protein n=1 Tax=Anaeromyxobacter sp. Red801 TaxID=3411632 RepID=UPI003BA2B3D2